MIEKERESMREGKERRKERTERGRGEDKRGGGLRIKEIEKY